MIGNFVIVQINNFHGEYEFLSNFYPVEIVFESHLYASVEHAYQAAKTLDDTERAWFRENLTAGQAKRLGRKITQRDDWQCSKLFIMDYLVNKKFENPELLEKLMETRLHDLVEGNNWGDIFWGVCKGVGKNHLGKILMNIRQYHQMQKFLI